MMQTPTNDANDANPITTTNKSKETKQFKISLKTCLKDFNPIQKDHLRVVKDQQVYVINIDNGLAYVSDGRYNGWIPEDVIEALCEPTLETIPIHSETTSFVIAVKSGITCS